MAVFWNGNPLIGENSHDFLIDFYGNTQDNVMIGRAGYDVLKADQNSFFSDTIPSTIITNSAGVWSTAEDTSVINSTTVPHTTVVFEAVSPQIEEFQVGVGAGAQITLDVDFGDDALTDTNTVVEIYAANGTTLLASNDDGGGDIGSPSAFDAFLQHTFTSAGTYIIRVKEFGVDPNFEAGDNFLLNVSLTGQPIAPGSIQPLVGDDRLYGGDGDDTMFGNGGNDTFYGGDGADAHYGGSGVDTVRYDDDNYIDLTISLANPALNTGEAAVGDTYFDIENVAGGPSDDIIIGDGNANQLFGLGGHDQLDGGIGADTTEGGPGDDKHIVDNASDTVIEVAGGGTNDVVFAKANYTLAAGVDVEFLQTISVAGTGAMTLIGNEKGQFVLGNAGPNSLYGGGGADTVSGFGGLDFIDGMTGHDTLTGGADIDRFVFRQPALNAVNSDLITDFSAQDEIWFDTATGTGAAINPAIFVSGSAALGPEDRFIYNQATGQLSFDSDGTGGIAQILFATLGQTTHFALTAADIILF